DNALARQRPDLRPGPNEATPLMVKGVLYTSTGLSQVASLDAATGRLLWSYDPGCGGYVHRGVAYWDGNGGDARVFMTANNGHLIALDAKTGVPVRGFGKNGWVDLTLGLRRPVIRKLISNTSPPIVCGNVVVVGGSVDDFQDRREMPPGDVRGFDARTGRQLWRFQSIPQPGEFGNDTWEDGSWRYTGAANVWTVMSYDPELDYVYLPFGTPNNDWYGGHRKGAGLFGESLVCLEAKTGRRVWHYQMVHHGVWDYDLPCAPNLLDVTVGGRRVKAIAQVSKQAFCYVFDRTNGRPLWPIEERAVPASTVPGEKTWPTQPYPTRPAAFDRQGLTDNDLIDFTPELKREAQTILREGGWHYGQLYLPPAAEKKSILMPGWVGGASWAGAAADPETGMLYVPSISNPMWLTLRRPKSRFADVSYKIDENGDHVEGPRGLPLVKPPYGRITAIDLNTGDHRWMAPLGEGPRNHPALRPLNLPPLGRNRRGYVVVTRTLLLVAQEGSWFQSGPPEEPPFLRAFDKATGRLLGQVSLPAPATGAPITYMAGGKQYVAIPVGGVNDPQELIVLSLP
ncbi:MAG: pyrroloquinoline quinone-dependent dehydrogenase, partial [Armatimonadetes bacterium]|nr:pyrroloquinoline quinone-dependent dehydrogenase [Armatimonadota bacterium]